MPVRTRPEGCCPARAVAQLPAAEQNALVATFKALADPTRLEIFRMVMGQAGPICSCDVVDHFALAQPTISHHLKVLREADLLSVRRVGIWSFYAPHPRAASLLRAAAGLVQPAAERALAS